MLNTVAEAVAFVNDVGSPNLKINLDTFHMNIEEDNVIHAIYTAEEKLGHIHLGENNRRFPGNGDFPWDELIKVLGKINYKGTVNFEPFILFGGEIANGISL